MPISNNSQNLKTETKQMSRFGLVGIINTAVDFGVYNLLFGWLNLAAVPANAVSASLAMVFSFMANKNFVFRVKRRSNLAQAAIFLAVTAVSVYIIQNLAIHTFTQIWPTPFEWGHHLLHDLGLNFFTVEFVVNNGAKAVGLAGGMVWNYLWYKRVVFKT